MVEVWDFPVKTERSRLMSCLLYDFALIGLEDTYLKLDCRRLHDGVPDPVKRFGLYEKKRLITKDE